MAEEKVSPAVVRSGPVVDRIIMTLLMDVHKSGHVVEQLRPEQHQVVHHDTIVVWEVCLLQAVRKCVENVVQTGGHQLASVLSETIILLVLIHQKRRKIWTK